MGGGGAGNVWFLVIYVFHRERYEPHRGLTASRGGPY